MTVNKISSEELLKRLDNGQTVTVLDVRSSDKIADYHINHSNVKSLAIEKTHFLGDDQVDSDVLSSLPKNNEIVLVCTTGNSARRVAEVLSTEGFQPTVLEGGVTSWRALSSLEKENSK
jgi:rhodanese-related sulfurtransferase